MIHVVRAIEASDRVQLRTGADEGGHDSIVIDICRWAIAGSAPICKSLPGSYPHARKCLIGDSLPGVAQLASRTVLVRSRCMAMRLTGTPASRMPQIVALSSSENRAIPTPPGRRTLCSQISQVLR